MSTGVDQYVGQWSETYLFTIVMSNGAPQYFLCVNRAVDVFRASRTISGIWVSRPIGRLAPMKRH